MGICQDGWHGFHPPLPRGTNGDVPWHGLRSHNRSGLGIRSRDSVRLRARPRKVQITAFFTGEVVTPCTGPKQRRRLNFSPLHPALSLID
jgi:hypothetical protein